MRMLLYIFLLCPLLISGTTVHAQTDDKAARPAAEAPAASPGKPQAAAEADARGRVWFDQCMEDWDKETHMSKPEWERTCRRMAQERFKNLREEGR